MLSLRQLLRTNIVQGLATTSVSRKNGTLVIADHSAGQLLPSTLNAIAAAKKVGGDISCLVIGKGVSEVAKQVSKADGLKKLLVAENDAFDGLLPGEWVSPQQTHLKISMPSSDVPLPCNHTKRRSLPGISFHYELSCFVLCRTLDVRIGCFNGVH